MLRLALLAAGALAAHNAMASCMPRTDDELKAMSDADLKGAYCEARAQSAERAAPAAPSLPSLPGGPNAGPRTAAPAANACLTATLQLVRVMETRKIDVDQARANCAK
ncbi:hypothetical protein CDO44_13410 [Pigmentiphaga sp. NML080357]|uniref:hypothetical protein n=1 Tax=Pigmentiphaga sp. NML080357 TaxID=2008675 RepID=UPI000B4074C4|nr:hypothetical protein [Pigmentiphaga sp. NML080357]OVZ59158.1 hypothetical protein CDO44_13410 [Pigmentiphaga sp. NML080357]